MLMANDSPERDGVARTVDPTRWPCQQTDSALTSPPTRLRTLKFDEGLGARSERRMAGRFARTP